MISPIRDPNRVAVPPLRDGDHMSVQEFERRWEATPDLKHAELIEWRVYMSATSLGWDWDSKPSGILRLTRFNYSAFTQVVLFGTDLCVQVEQDRLPQRRCVLPTAQKLQSEGSNDCSA